MEQHKLLNLPEKENINDCSTLSLMHLQINLCIFVVIDGGCVSLQFIENIAK